jgi:hypothetical protein
MSTTPATGTYLVTFSGEVDMTTNDTGNIGIYLGGTLINHTERSHVVTAPFVGANPTWASYTQALITAGGSQTVDVRYSVVGTATITITERSLILLRVS